MAGPRATVKVTPIDCRDDGSGCQPRPGASRLLRGWRGGFGGRLVERLPQRRFHAAGALVAQRRIVAESPLDDVHVGLRQFGPKITQPPALAPLMRTGELFERRSGYGKLAGDKIEEKNAEAVEIADDGRRLARKDFRREVQRRAASRSVACFNSSPVPKSIRTIRPPVSRITFCALRSRCASPAAWTAASAPAEIEAD